MLLDTNTITSLRQRLGDDDGLARGRVHILLRKRFLRLKIPVDDYPNVLWRVVEHFNTFNFDLFHKFF